MARVQYYVEASDGVGNVSKSPVYEYEVGISFWIHGLVIGGVVLLILVAVLRSRKKPGIPPPPP